VPFIRSSYEPWDPGNALVGERALFYGKGGDVTADTGKTGVVSIYKNEKSVAAPVRRDDDIDS
jgi:hypothetical protein